MFKLGDKVRCTTPPGTHQLNSNEVYTVTWISSEGLISVNKCPDMMWTKYRFELVPSIMPTN